MITNTSVKICLMKQKYVVCMAPFKKTVLSLTPAAGISCKMLPVHLSSFVK